MEKYTITTPKRRNEKFSNVLKNVTDKNFEIAFVTEESEVVLNIVLTVDAGIVNLETFDSKYDYITKLIERSFEESAYNVADMEGFFYNLQKRLKSEVRGELKSKETPQVKEEVKETPIVKEAPQVKNEIKEVKLEKQMTSVKIERPKAVGLEAQLQDIVFNVLESNFTTQTLQNKMIELGLEPNRTEITVKKFDGTQITITDQHFKFNQILQCVSAKVNVALVGPAGSGKTTVVRNVAKALDLPFYSKSVSAQTGTHEFFGYQDANGKYVRTLFREAYENGGVFLLDEFDAGNPNVLASMNQATANGECAFADGMITKHEDFIVVMAGNTFGHGATSEYVGRNKIDSATLDRFAFIEFGYDENLEMKLSTNKEWCKKVQEIRKNVVSKKIKTIVSPRATFMGERLLKTGMDMNTVIELVILKGLSEAERKLLK